MQDVRQPGDGRDTGSDTGSGSAPGRDTAGTARPGGARKRGPLASAHFMLSRRVPAPASGAAVPAGGILLMAVPKRLLKRAVDRNTLRRIAREAWRAGASPRRPQAPALLRLAKRPAGFDTLSQRARKRLWREEIDALLARDAA